MCNSLCTKEKCLWYPFFTKFPRNINFNRLLLSSYLQLNEVKVISPKILTSTPLVFTLHRNIRGMKQVWAYLIARMKVPPRTPYILTTHVPSITRVY